MSTLRTLVLIASGIQLAIGAFIGYMLFFSSSAGEQSGIAYWLLMLVASTVVIAGTTGIVALLLRSKPSSTRASSAKLNLFLFVLIGGAGAAIFFLEHQQGMSTERMQIFAMLYAALVGPFLLNTMALGIMERRFKKTA
ncbi:MAG: hypothetical protein AAF432_02535 [Planctomycetota bacterium]